MEAMKRKSIIAAEIILMVGLGVTFYADSLLIPLICLIVVFIIFIFHLYSYLKFKFFNKKDRL